MKYFISWANKLMKHSASQDPGATGGAQRESQGVRQSASASQPQPRADGNSRLAHEQLVEKAKRGGIDVYFVGDSCCQYSDAGEFFSLHQMKFLKALFGYVPQENQRTIHFTMHIFDGSCSYIKIVDLSLGGL